MQERFELALPADEAWRLLTDLDRVLPRVPGAAVDAVVDGEGRGRLDGRVGPVAVAYAGSARFLERDDVDRRAVIALRGREEDGGGALLGTLAAAVRPAGEHAAQVEVAAELDVSGRAAQFGADVLEAALASGLRDLGAALAAPEPEPEPEPVVTEQHPEPQSPSRSSDNGMATAARRAAVPAALVALAGTAGWLLRRRR